MRQVCDRTARGLIVFGLLAMAGCGESLPNASSSNEEATVSGTVTVRGKPVEGTISFDPATIRRKDAAIRTATVDKSGHYTVKTLVGDNRVTFANPEIAKDGKLVNPSVQIDVKSGDNTHDVTLGDAESDMLSKAKPEATTAAKAVGSDSMRRNAAPGR